MKLMKWERRSRAGSCQICDVHDGNEEDEEEERITERGRVGGNTEWGGNSPFSR